VKDGIFSTSSIKFFLLKSNNEIPGISLKKEFKDVLPNVPKTVEIFFDSFPKISSCAFV